MLVAWPPVTVVKRVPSSTAEASESTTAELGAPVPQIVSGVAAWAMDAVQMAAPVTDSATALAIATPALDPLLSRSRGTKVMRGTPFAHERFQSVQVVVRAALRRTTARLDLRIPQENH